jgi:2-octaprenyl-6-methoxyphenol hydroxylase
MVIKKKIIVKGSGIIAYLCALMLTKYGINVVHIVKGIPKKNDMFFAITPNSVEWLKKLGFPPKFFNELQKINQIHLDAEILKEEVILNADEFFIDGLAFMAEQKNFVEALDELNPDITSIVDDGNISYTFNEEGVDIVADQDVISASLLIVCDEKDNLIDEAKFKIKQTDYKQTAFTFTFCAKKGRFNQASQFFFEDSILALLPVSQNEVGVVWSCNEKLKKDLVSMADQDLEDYFQDRIKETFFLEKGLKNRNTFELKAKSLNTITYKKLLLMGDAAHIIHPMAGQGLNLGLRDVRCFEELIDQNNDYGSKNFLRKYERLRARDTAQFSNLTSLISHVTFDNKNYLDRVSKSKLLSKGVKKLISNKYFKNYLVKQAIL